MAELSDGPLSASEMKKKKKKKKSELKAEAGPSSPRSPDHRSLHDKGGEACRETGNKQRKPSDFHVDASCASSEETSKAGTGILIHRKKKKKEKRVPVDPDDAGLPASQEKTSTSPRTEAGREVELGPVRKKKSARALFSDQAEANPPNPSRQDGIVPSELEDTEPELFASSPLSQTQPSSFILREGPNPAASAEPGSPLAAKKPRKKKKGSRSEESDTADSHAAEDEVGLTNRGTRPPRSRPKQGALQGRNRSINSPSPVHETEEEEEASPPGQPPSQAPAELDNPYMEFSELSGLDLGLVTKELESFIPHVRKLSASNIKQLAQRDLIRFKNFRQEGVSVKFGKFTRKENQQLMANVEAFLETSGIETAERLLFPDRFPEEKPAIQKLKAKHLFGVKIAEGIPRPWRLVYSRARKIFDPQNNNGEYSMKEIKKLKKYHAMYGNNWKKISELIHRSGHSVAMKYSQIRSEPRSGRWSKGEVKRLIQGVEKVIRSKVDLDSALEERDAGRALSLMREHLYKGIAWTEVEAMVGTRHWRQCRHKWMGIVTQRMSRGESSFHGPENLQAKINLIERMYQLNIEDANEIDWEDLSSAIGNVPPDYVQRRFYRMKMLNVPNWNNKGFPDIIDHLYKVTLPEYKRQLLCHKETFKPSQESTQKTTYKFSDIFWVSDDDMMEDEIVGESQPDTGSS